MNGRNALECPSCNGTEIEHIAISGDAVCVSCGTILEQNNIVSSVEFFDSGGTTSAAGQFVSMNGLHSYRTVNSSGRSYGTESRAVTLEKNQRNIRHIAGILHLSDHFVDSAFRLYALALQRNFTKGRRNQSIIAACLYIVCRRERSPHLLIDFSDKLQLNVYALGGVYLKFCKLLQVQLPMIDPSLYIHRFASQLRFASQTHAIATTALRLVASMKRDWILTGRRPSGICGAALLIAARCHGVFCGIQDVIDVVSIGEHTLRLRLQEFALTPSAQLTYEQIGKIDMTFVECDPPCYQKQEQKHSEATRNESMEKRVMPLDEKEKSVKEALALRATQKAAEEMLLSLKKKTSSLLVRKRAEMALYKSLEQELHVAIEDDLGKTDVVEPLAQRAEETEDTLSDLDDEEIDSMLLTQREVDEKAVLWEKMNGEFFRRQEAKRALKSTDANLKKKRRKKEKMDRAPPQDTAEHALYKLKSRNINYDVIDELFSDVV